MAVSSVICTGKKTLHIVANTGNSDLKRLEIFYWNCIAMQLDAWVCMNPKVAFMQAVMQYTLSLVPVVAIWKDRKFYIVIA